jgi:hypothetical protein
VPQPKGVGKRLAEWARWECRPAGSLNLRHARRSNSVDGFSAIGKSPMLIYIGSVTKSRPIFTKSSPLGRKTGFSDSDSSRSTPCRFSMSAKSPSHSSTIRCLSVLPVNIWAAARLQGKSEEAIDRSANVFVNEGEDVVKDKCVIAVA